MNAKTLTLLFLAVAVPSIVLNAEETQSVADATTSSAGVRIHEVESSYQAGKTYIRVLLPDEIDVDKRYPTIYVLPVEAGDERRFGNGLDEVQKHDLHNKHQAIFVAPTFSHLPWYADHPTNLEIRQGSYFLQVVVPFIEKNYPAQATVDGRLLLGFSKSGWGAWSLVLRHPKTFGRAVAWDAPLMMDQLGKFGTTEIFGDETNFQKYCLKQHAQELDPIVDKCPRLVMLGEGNFQSEHVTMNAWLAERNVTHTFRAGEKRKHTWDSGWVPEAVEMLLHPEKE